jgi:hypothetical protein
MKHAWLTILVLLLISGLSVRAAEDKLVLASQGSFFVGGETKKIGTGPSPQDDVTINQMYVQYQIPVGGDQRVPVVMVHGCCLSSKTWETTPDGRMGWNEYFVRRGVRFTSPIRFLVGGPGSIREKSIPFVRARLLPTNFRPS